MKAAQIAGLSVAAAATFIIAIGLMVLSVCLRKRKERRGVVEIIDEKRPASVAPKKPSGRFSRRFTIKSRQPPVQQLKLPPPRADPFDPRGTHPALHPGTSGANGDSDTSLPLDQIGVAVSAELPDRSLPATRPPRFPMRVSSRQERPKSVVRRSEDPFKRPDSIMSQGTVFEEEEDAPPERRRSSKLLPTPPIPIPPIRSFQPSRTQPPYAAPRRTPLTRQQAQQPELSLDIPIRHSRTLPLMPLSLEDMTSQVSPQAPGTTLQISSVYDQYKSMPTNASTPEVINDIPDYYFTSNRSSPNHQLPKSAPRRAAHIKESPKYIAFKPKNVSSNVSRTSRGSSNPRDSISSQTSFETVDEDDPTPEEEDDDDRQLSEDSKLSPVAESPISHLRYPKVPRASNQLVPRSPRSPQSIRSDQSFQSPRQAPEPSSLLVKRRGEQEAMKLGGRLHMVTGTNGLQYRQHSRNNTTETVFSSHRSSSHHTRSQSGQWPPMSPGGGLMSPAWVPELTPKRLGDDLLISVSYSKPQH
ncbi:hypothetical protein BCR34DRAFT_471824 [Clohesyomyces aquaticus]|uniref:Uncharacterized protein n=1 Tax=Clohesyomyces aquaticus TaxID=1231657 RepID=A0A1Y2AAK3_9PLEO|nr:hypothetical protein BCR34DRAFT_471824 [Clohesyomyces aquaticus]